MCTALHCRTELLQLAFDLCHPERERACYVIRQRYHQELGSVCQTPCLLFDRREQFLKHVIGSDIQLGCVSI